MLVGKILGFSDPNCKDIELGSGPPNVVRAERSEGRVSDCGHARRPFKVVGVRLMGCLGGRDTRRELRGVWARALARGRPFSPKWCSLTAPCLHQPTPALALGHSPLPSARLPSALATAWPTPALGLRPRPSPSALWPLCARWRMARSTDGGWLAAGSLSEQFHACWAFMFEPCSRASVVAWLPEIDFILSWRSGQKVVLRKNGTTAAARVWAALIDSPQRSQMMHELLQRCRSRCRVAVSACWMQTAWPRWP